MWVLRKGQIGMRHKILAVCAIMLLLLLATACSRNQGMSEEELYQQAIDTVLDALGVPNPLESTIAESSPPPAEPDAPAEPSAPAQPNAPEPSVPTMPAGAQDFEMIDADLGLPIRTTETTFAHLGVVQRITADNILQQRSSNTFIDIDTNVRTFAHATVGNVQTTFYIKNDNTLWGMGQNAQGLLGDGSGVNREEPIHIMDNVAAIYIWGTSTGVAYAVQLDGSLWTWGGGRFYPVQIAENVASILDRDFSTAIVHKRTGFVYRVNHMQGNSPMSEPEITRMLPVPALYVTMPRGHVGRVNHGLLYIDAERNLMQRHYRLVGGVNVEFVNEEHIASNVESVFVSRGLYSTGPQNMLILKTDGSLWGVGPNRNGDLGDGTRVPREEPVQIAENVAIIVQKVSDAGRMAFIKQDGTYWAWNANDPTPQHTLDGVVMVLNNVMQFDDGRVIVNTGAWNETEIDNVKLPRTLTFE